MRTYAYTTQGLKKPVPDPLLSKAVDVLKIKAKQAGANAIALLRAAIEKIAEHSLEPCSCQRALELAIWSDRAAVDPAAVKRYGPLVQKYFEV